MKDRKTDWGFTRFVNGEKKHGRNDYKPSFRLRKQGVNVWPGSKGTYVRAIHGELSI